MDNEEFDEQYGEDADLNKISIRIKQAFLKTREAHQLIQKNPNISKDEAKKTTNSIEPSSDEMHKVLEKQKENV